MVNLLKTTAFLKLSTQKGGGGTNDGGYVWVG